ncbi:MAG TPA: potassium channel protein [Polyangiaceae bacterium]|nr:potassium channel protein [Polyangiaceae bacterium]
MADNAIRSRFWLSAAILTGVVLGSGLLFWSLEGNAYSLFDSVYFALITVSTVGYSELPRMDLLPTARMVVMGMIVAGVAAVAFFQSSLTAVMVEGVIGRAWRRRIMDRKIAALRGHTIVAGCGRTGRFVIEELVGSGKPFVVIDQNEKLIEQLQSEHDGKLLYVVGDATDDASLKAAGVERAAGLVTALTDDPENVFVTISTRSLNPSIRIVAKVVAFGAEAKLERAGANATVSPHRIGGLRLVTELLRPHTAEFLDQMMRGTGEGQLRFDDVEVRHGTPYDGKTLREAAIRDKADVLVVAMRGPDGKFVYNPPAETAIRSGSYIVVLGTQTAVSRLREMLGDRG